MRTQTCMQFPFAAYLIGAFVFFLLLNFFYPFWFNREIKSLCTGIEHICSWQVAYLQNNCVAYLQNPRVNYMNPFFDVSPYKLIFSGRNRWLYQIAHCCIDDTFAVRMLLILQPMLLIGTNQRKKTFCLYPDLSIDRNRFYSIEIDFNRYIR